MRTFHFRQGKSQRFWSIDLKGRRYTVRYGAAGKEGRTLTREFATAEQARKAHDRLIREKLAAGYVEAAAPAAPLRQALEEALVANPDDVAAHMAYADWLTEQGDPRGEFIQVQMRLEQAAELPTAERERLWHREEELLRDHGRVWLGELAGVAEAVTDLEPRTARDRLHRLTSESGPRNECRFARGWVDELLMDELTLEESRVLARRS